MPPKKATTKPKATTATLAKETTTPSAPSAPSAPYTLVLVESPSKCSTIEKYLGEGYKVMATYGHFRSLSSLKNIVFSKDGSTLDLQFELDEGKKEKHINQLKRAIKSATNGVVLATDDDREGEAIAWHICDYFNLSVIDTPRIVFHEITKDAIATAIQNPTRVNMNLVHAQFTRQVLDLFIGFKISPLLWTYVSNNDKNSLSAGRCQTPALKMIVDNQTHINNTPTTLQYNITANFTSLHIPFRLTTNFSTQEEVQDFLEKSKTHAHTITTKPATTATRSSPSPLNTSRLQQLASNEFHLSPKATMQICQHLYENGLITYMRTENTKYSRAFLAQTRKYLDANGKGTDFTDSPGRLTETNHMAHEAIRPTNLNTAHLPSAKYDSRTCRMYRLIWETSVASFMKPAVVSVRQATISAPDGHVYTHSAELPVYAGWKSVVGGGGGGENNILKGLSRNDERGSSAYNFFENLSQGIEVTPTIIEAKQECVGSRNQLHYTESALIRLLEEEGIGRPSTFASIVDKIQTRNYVSKATLEGTTIDCVDFVLEPKGLLTSTSTATITATTIKKTFGAEKNKLVVQPMGIVVSRFLYQHFEPLFNYSYTRDTETLLDAIHEGTSNWIEVCANQKQYIANLVKQAKAGNIQRFNIPIDDTHCYMIAKYGPVIKQTIPPGNPQEGQEPDVKWLPVRKDIDIIRLERGEYTLQELLHIKPEPGNPAYLAEHTPGGLPLYGGHYFGVYEDKEIIIRKGKFGRYAAWGDENRSLRCFGTRNIANITMEEMAAILAKPKRASTAPRPSGGAAPTPAPSIEQIPKAPTKTPTIPLAPKAPKKATKESKPETAPTPPQTQPQPPTEYASTPSTEPTTPVPKKEEGQRKIQKTIISTNNINEHIRP